MKVSWLQFINHGTESIYDLMNGVAVYKVPATSVQKTEMELLFEVKSMHIYEFSTYYQGYLSSLYSLVCMQLNMIQSISTTNRLLLHVVGTRGRRGA